MIELLFEGDYEAREARRLNVESALQGVLHLHLPFTLSDFGIIDSVFYDHDGTLIVGVCLPRLDCKCSQAFIDSIQAVLEGKGDDIKVKLLSKPRSSKPGLGWRFEIWKEAMEICEQMGSKMSPRSCEGSACGECPRCLLRRFSTRL